MMTPDRASAAPAEIYQRCRKHSSPVCQRRACKVVIKTLHAVRINENLSWMSSCFTDESPSERENVAFG